MSRQAVAVAMPGFSFSFSLTMRTVRSRTSEEYLCGAGMSPSFLLDETLYNPRGDPWGMPPDMLLDSEDADTVEPAGVIDQQLLAGGEDRGVDGVPRRAEACSDAADGHPVDDEAFQRPQHGRS